MLQGTSQEKTLIRVSEQSVEIEGGGEGAEPAVLVVHPHPFLRVHVNGTIVTGKCYVSASDQVEVQLDVTPPQRTMDMRVDEDALAARLQIEYVSGMQRKLRPGEASHQVALIVEETPWHEDKYTMAEIEQYLAEKRISVGIDKEAILAIAAGDGLGECVCARGVQPVLGIPSRYDLVVEESNDVTLVGIIPIQPVLNVTEGTTIAEYRREQPGTPGVNVYGEEVQPPAVRTNLPVLGKGVRLDETGRVIAARAGRVVFTQKLLDVTETVTVERSLRAADGYLMFNGDVVIRGDVEDGAEVVAGGRIFVSGMVSRANLSADDGIVVNGGVFASTLRAGKRQASLVELAGQVRTFLEQFQEFIQAVEQVRSALAARGANVPTGTVAAKLLGERFKDFLLWPATLQQWVEAHGTSAGSSWVTYVNQLTGELSASRITAAHDASGWAQLIQVTQKKLTELPTDEGSSADIQIRNGQNCDIHATGNIVSTNQGYYQCNIVAGGEVRAMGNPGVVLACTMTALRVVAREIGSQMEAHTTIHLTEKEGSVETAKLHPGTTLTVGTWRHNVAKEMRNVTWP